MFLLIKCYYKMFQGQADSEAGPSFRSIQSVRKKRQNESRPSEEPDVDAAGPSVSEVRS